MSIDRYPIAGSQSSGGGVPTDGSVTNAKVAANAAIALSKLATDPLARANHTGNQAISTVTGLQTGLDGKTALSVDGVFQTTYDLDTTAVTPGDIGAQPVDSDLTAIAAIAPTNDDVLQRKAGAWTNRTVAQLKSDLGVSADIAAAIAGVINSAPGALDTLDELAAALGDDANFASTVTTALAGKAADTAVVHNTGAETVAGVKTFSSSPVVPDASFAEAKVINLVSDLAGKQPLDSDLTTIAALDATTAGAMTTDGSGWIRKTYAQLKTALSLVKGDVGLGSVDNTADTAKPVSTAQRTAIVAGAYGNSVWAAGSAEAFPRGGAGVGMGTGIAVFAYFTAPTATTITKLGVAVTDSGASSGLTLSRLGLYTVDGSGNLALVARTANDTAIGGTNAVPNSASLATAGGFPASYQFTAGNRYAFAWLQVGTTPSGVAGETVGNGAGIAPRLSGRAFSQTDLATSYTDTDVGGFWYMRPWIVGLP